MMMLTWLRTVLLITLAFIIYTAVVSMQTGGPQPVAAWIAWGIIYAVEWCLSIYTDYEKIRRHYKRKPKAKA